jgi:hypothetical protein
MVALGDGGEVTGCLDQIGFQGAISLASGTMTAGTVVLIHRFTHVVLKLSCCCEGQHPQTQSSQSFEWMFHDMGPSSIRWQIANSLKAHHDEATTRRLFANDCAMQDRTVNSKRVNCFKVAPDCKYLAIPISSVNLSFVSDNQQSNASLQL